MSHPRKLRMGRIDTKESISYPEIGLGAGDSSMAREHAQNTFVEGSYPVSLQT